MRILILSEDISRRQSSGEDKYTAPYGVTLDVADPNESDGLAHSLFDYDVSIVHIASPTHHTIGYFENLPKLLADAIVALENGRVVICLPASDNFRTRRSNEYGMRAYEWIENLGIPLSDNEGVDIKASETGRATVFQKYLLSAPKYYQIVTLPNPPKGEILAVVDDTDIVVGISHNVVSGKLVILPPPVLLGDVYQLSMSRIVDVSRHFFELIRRHIPVQDKPEWLDAFLVSEATELNEKIAKLQIEKSRFDLIGYSLYGTGEALEYSVMSILEDLGLDVEKQPPGANIDLRATHPTLGISYSIEVTGIKGVVRKSSNKVSQAWQHISDRAGTPQEGDRLIIVANTECHMKPSARKPEAFTGDVAGLLSDNGVLLLTAVQLYSLWKEVFEGTRQVEEVLQGLHESVGIYG